jgi:DNA-binding transcriptional LysR family regulator
LRFEGLSLILLQSLLDEVILCQTIISIVKSDISMDISSDFLRTFVQVSKVGSISEAARTLHKSQSAVSTQIASLEDQAGLKYFDRSERPLRLTESGHIFLRFAREFINRTDALGRSLNELASGVAGEVRIGATVSISAYLLPRFVIGLEHDSQSGYTDMITRLLRKAGCSKYTVGLQISNVEGIKEAVRSGVGISILPWFSVKREISENVLSEVKVRGIRLSASLMSIERPGDCPSPGVASIKALLEGNLKNGPL